MTKSPMATGPTWTDRFNLTPETYAHLRHGTAVWQPCGYAWDAVVIAPLQRGLDALDVLALPLDAGYPVIADHSRQELITYVANGSGHMLAGVQGVRVLVRGSDLLTPAGEYGTYAAHWLSRPCVDADHYVDAGALRTALLAVDALPPIRADQIEHAPAS
ncbi:hypothetical protein ACWGE1_09400 [Streptomyces sp. NPDC054932]